jgi:hypothetical protein
MKSFKDLVNTTKAANKMETSGKVQILPAGVYMAEKPRFRQTFGISNEKKNPWGNLEFMLKINDPKMEEENLPVRDLTLQLQSFSMKDASMGLGFEVTKTEDGDDFILGLDPKQNPRFWNVLGHLFSFVGLADADSNYSNFAYPEGGACEQALREDEAYLKAGEAIMNREMPLDLKGKPVEDDRLFGMVMVAHQVNALGSLLKVYDEKNAFSFKVEVDQKFDDYANTDINTIKRVWAIHNDKEYQVF